LYRKIQGINSALYRKYRGRKFANRLFAAVTLLKISQMPKKEKISVKAKSQKTDKQLADEIDKIIKVAEEQNLAIRKLMKSSTKIIKTKAL
jgi:hypothetical protein